MAEASLKLGGSWATKEGSLLGFNDQNGNYKPIPFDFTRATTATRVNRNGLIEEVQSGIPRIDFTGSDGSLLLEPQRTNLILNSERISLSPVKNGTFVDNFAISPDGTQNATKLTATTTDPYFYQNATFSAGDYTASIWVKGIGDSIGQEFRFAISNVTHTANKYVIPAEWTRFEFTATIGAGTVSTGLELPDPGIVGHEVLVWGWQVEAGSYPTSYIKTSGSAVTRNADNSIVTSASDLIGQTEGTLFIECEYPRTGSGGAARKLISVNDGSAANLVDIFVNAGANTLTARVRANSGQFGVIAISNNPTGVVKIAYAYKANDYVLYINGTQYGSVTTGGAFTFSSALDVIQIGDGEAANDELGGKCPQAMLYKTRLTNTELAELTTI